MEIATLCQSLNGISKRYSYFIQNAKPEQNLQPCDNVTQITKDGIIVALGDYAVATCTHIEQSSAIFKFGERLTQTYHRLLGKQQPDNVTVFELHHLSQVSKPVENDLKASISISSIKIDGGVHIHFEADNMKANAFNISFKK